jgi:hypothetical protein
MKNAPTNLSTGRGGGANTYLLSVFNKIINLVKISGTYVLFTLVGLGGSAVGLIVLVAAMVAWEVVSHAN